MILSAMAVMAFKTSGKAGLIEKLTWRYKEADQEASSLVTPNEPAIIYGHKINQPVDYFGAYPDYIKSAARDKVIKIPSFFGETFMIWAPCHDLSFRFNNYGSATGAFLRHLKFSFFSGS